MILLSTIALWLAFITTAKIADDANSREDLNTFQCICVVLFLIVDVLYNYTYGAVLYLEFASNKRKTLTARMKHLLHKTDDTEFMDKYYRKPLARFMCKYMVEPWDYNHCGLQK